MGGGGCVKWNNEIPHDTSKLQVSDGEMGTIDRFVRVILVISPDRFKIELWDGERWNTIREVLTNPSVDEHHRRAQITAENVALKIKNMALHFAISEIRNTRNT